MKKLIKLNPTREGGKHRVTNWNNINNDILARSQSGYTLEYLKSKTVSELSQIAAERGFKKSMIVFQNYFLFRT